MSATLGPLIVTFGEDAGYDCLSAAYDIRPAVRPEDGAGPRILATLDVANYLPNGTREYELAHARHADAESNARLFAAAPDLLAALEAARDFLENPPDNFDDYLHARRPVRRAILDAIQKATEA